MEVSPVSLIWMGRGIEETVISAPFHGWKLLVDTDFTDGYIVCRDTFVFFFFFLNKRRT